MEQIRNADPRGGGTEPPKAPEHVPEPGSIEVGAGRVGSDDGAPAAFEEPDRGEEKRADSRSPADAGRSEGVESGEP